jgi:peptidoglycan LD-endopeptidase CwlK
MPLDLVARLDLDQLHLPFLQRVLELLARCRERGADYFAISGYRSPEEQARLYFQGRTLPGPIVTRAKPYDSPHQYGIAVDLCRDGVLSRRGLQPDWRPASYDVLGEEAQKLGLEWGGTWKFKDRPHVQLPGYVTPAQLRPLKAELEGGGLTAVFQWLDQEAARV